MPSEYATVQDKEDALRKAKLVRALKIARDAANEADAFGSWRDSFPAAISILAAAIYKTL